jgi:ABC-type nitrate/sulfonate/bicarbonate transport system substrate-binding protein
MHRLKHVKGVFRILLGLSLSLALSAGAGHAQNIKKKVRISYPAPSICCLSLFAAHRWKVFEENGLTSEIILARSQAANAALVSGDINYVAGVGPNSISATLRGMPSRAIWFASNKSIYSLMAGPKVKSLKDLRSHRIGISGLGGTSEVSLRIALEAVGENPKNFVIMGVGGRQLLTALSSGSVDAVQLNPPYIFFAKKKGFHEVLDVGAHVEMPIGGLTTLVSTLQDKPDEVKRVIRSIQQAKDMMVQSKARSVDLISNFLKVDKETAEDTFATYKATISESGIPTPAGIQKIVNAVQMLGNFKGRKVAFDEVADDRFAREVAKELGYKIN